MTANKNHLLLAGTSIAVIIAGFTVVVVLFLFIAKQNEVFHAGNASLHEELEILKSTIDCSNENINREMAAERILFQEKLESALNDIERVCSELAMDTSFINRQLFQEFSKLAEQIVTLEDTVSYLKILTMKDANPVSRPFDEHRISEIATMDPIGAKAMTDLPSRMSFDAGLAAYESGLFHESYQHFMRASQLDTGNMRIRAYMAAVDYLANPTIVKNQGTRLILESYIYNTVLTCSYFDA